MVKILSLKGGKFLEKDWNKIFLLVCIYIYRVFIVIMFFEILCSYKRVVLIKKKKWIDKLMED